MQPVDDFILTVVGADPGIRVRLEEWLRRRNVPAIVMESDPKGGLFPVRVRMLADTEGDPLSWATRAPGRHSWEPVDGGGLVEEIATDLRCWVDSPYGEIDGTHLAPGSVDRASTDSNAGGDTEIDFDQVDVLDGLTWYSPGNTDIVSVLARESGEAWNVCNTGAGYVAEPTVSAERVFSSFFWEPRKGELFLVRSGARRGAGFWSSVVGLEIRWWDEIWTHVDPSERWEADAEGRHVREYLDDVVPEASAPLWVENFGLDARHAEELRIVLRSAVSDENTFDRVVSAVGLPPLLAEVASGRTRLLDVDGAETIQPSTVWQTMRNMASDEWKRPLELPEWASPLVAWQRRWQERRRRRSPGYLALMGTAFVAVAALLSMKLADGAGIETEWWRFALLGYCILDVAWPRRAAESESTAADEVVPPQP